MKTITYKVTYQTDTSVQTEKVTMTARSINGGFVKATQWAVRNLPQGWDMHSVEFWEVA